ncbi:hypothetical protein P154DRAFT_523952 [Amniculicola lignicola CBS 123094]|uniref:Uncharacterized protein n=1 Tax=Amniculicola lignicola CBS 123094 TaxID=1392246 RepID=A0A6A5WEV4_9PLEO|nr:hypothetical protein P154DRAFT_523952 [Amniculicola lignicola CBS 123094]
MLRWYQTRLKAAPLVTQAATTAILFATGDVLSQHAVEKVEKHNYARTGRMGFYGGAIFGPAAVKWYTLLATRINLSTTNRTIAARVAADQLLFAPTNMTLFLSSMALMEGSSPVQKLQTSWTTGMKMNFLLWPWVQGVNFRFVPLEHRVLVVNVVALGWNCYLSFLNSGNSDSSRKSIGGDSVEEKEKKTHVA